MLYTPIMFLENSLTYDDAKVYTLKSEYFNFFKHDNKHIYLMCEAPFIEDHLEEFHRKGLLVFKDSSKLNQFFRINHSKAINLNLDFDSWGEFNFENIIDFCDSNTLYYTHAFRTHIFPETLLDLGEFLEENKCFQVDSSLRIFKAPPLNLENLKARIHEMGISFEKLEWAYMALEALASNKVSDNFEEYLKKTIPPDGMHQYYITSYTFKDLGIPNIDNCRKELKQAIDLIGEIETIDDGLRCFDSIDYLVLTMNRVFEIRFEHEEFNDRIYSRHKEIFLNLNKVDVELTNQSPKISISRSKTLKNTEEIHRTKTSTTYRVRVVVS